MFDAFLAVFFTAVVIILVWLARGAILTPVPLGKGQSMSVTIFAGENSAQTLEQTVRALNWLRNNGTLPLSSIIIKNAGMASESKMLAAKLSQLYPMVEFITE